MNRYETVFIMTPVLSADQVTETVEKYRALIIANGGKTVHEDAWGLAESLLTQFRKRQLAFTTCSSMSGKVQKDPQN